MVRCALALVVVAVASCGDQRRPDSLALTPSSLHLHRGESAVVAASYGAGGVSYRATGLTWATSDAGVITSDAHADGTATITALQSGTATVTCSGMGLTATITAEVAPPSIVAIAITPDRPSIAAGTTSALVATAMYDDGSAAGITSAATWASDATEIATVSAGVVTAVAKGTATITARADGVTGSATVTVTDAELVSIAVTPPAPTLAAGTSRQMTATGTFSDATVQDLTAAVTWSSDSAHATVVPSGRVDAVSAGDAVVSATLGTISGSTTVHVTAAQLVSIDVAPVDPSIPKGLDRGFTATGHFTDATVQDLTTLVVWASSDGAVATVSPGGTVHAVAVGTATIGATSGGIVGGSKVTVTPAELTSIVIAPVDPSVALGLVEAFHATGIFTDTTTMDLTSQVVWASSDGTVATISNAAGTNGIASTRATGTTTISATLGGVSGTTTLTVTAAIIVSIAITPDAPSVAKGIAIQLTATATLSDGSKTDVTTQTTWQSDAPAIADVSNAAGSQGRVAALQVGQATITATSSGRVGATTVTVTPATLVAITVSPAAPAFPFDPANPIQWVQPMTAMGSFSDGSGLDVTRNVAWSSSDPSVATVDNIDPAQGRVTVVGLGTATISATRDGIVGATGISVVPATLTALAIEPQDPTIEKTKSLRLAATGTFSNGMALDMTEQVTWSVDDPTIATVSDLAGERGLVSALAPGSTVVHATASIDATTTVTVTDSQAVIDVAFAGDATGEVAIDADFVQVASCTASCSVAVVSGTDVVIRASTPSHFGGCTGPGGACSFIATAGTNAVTVTFAKDPGQRWTRLLLDEPVFAAAYDAGGNLFIATSRHIWKLDPSGRIIDGRTISPQAIAVGLSGQTVVIWSNYLVSFHPDWLHPIAVAPISVPRPYLHDLAIGPSGEIAVHLDTDEVSVYEPDGTLRWTRNGADPGTSNESASVTIAGTGSVWCPAENANPDVTDLLGFAPDGTPLATLHPTSSYHGMATVDRADHLVTSTSGHGTVRLDRRSQSDVADFQLAVSVADPDFVENGVAAAGTGQLAWVHDFSEVLYPVDGFVLRRVEPDGAITSTITRPGIAVAIGVSYGVTAVDVAADAAGNVALVGTYRAPSGTYGWIQVFAP